MAMYVTSRAAVPHCSLCGRVRLSRTEYVYRQANGLPVWRCQHWRNRRRQNRDVIEALILIVILAVIALTQWPHYG